MKIKINEHIVEIADGTTLRQVIEERVPQEERVATAVNDELVRASDRDAFILKDGDSLIIIKAFYGG